MFAYSSDEDLRVELAEAQKLLETLESGKLHVGLPSEGRTEAQIRDLKKKIAMYQSILEYGQSGA